MKTRPRPLAHRRKALFPPRSILVPLDFTPASEAALSAARRLAERFSCRLELAHVDEGPPPALSQGATDPFSVRELEAYRSRLRLRLEASRGGSAHCAIHLVEGLPEEVVPRLARDAAADLVVMGTHGRRGLGRLAFGSVAESAVHVCRAPVLVMRAEPPPPWPRRVLVGAKPGEEGDEALKAAGAWARLFGASLAVVSVSEEGLRPVSRSELRHRVAAALHEDDPEPEFLFRAGRPYAEIVAAAREEGSDLVVVAARAHGRLAEALIGTTAERVIRLSPAPVLAVPG